MRAPCFLFRHDETELANSQMDPTKASLLRALAFAAHLRVRARRDGVPRPIGRPILEWGRNLGPAVPVGLLNEDKNNKYGEHP